jgi:thiopeptide-type bacteriocin biosynthesis protein
MKKKFMIGDEWLFYKLYSGFKSADRVICEVVRLLTEELFRKGIIDKWFFIRYSDPELHLRVRFHYNDKESVGIIINSMNSAISEFVLNGTVSKVIIDVYERELNRYGENTIEVTESIFGIDSAMMLNFISFLSDKGDLSEHIRWRFALIAVDRLLSDFGMDITEKMNTITKFRDNFNTEFGVEKYLKKQLYDNYRDSRKDIEELMRDQSKYEYTLVFDNLLDLKSNMTRSFIDGLLDPGSRFALKIDKTDYIASLSHMMLNRLFRSNQRAQEMVLYNYLWKYYDSILARNKSKEKKVQKANETVLTA